MKRRSLIVACLFLLTSMEGLARADDTESGHDRWLRQAKARLHDRCPGSVCSEVGYKPAPIVSYLAFTRQAAAVMTLPIGVSWEGFRTAGDVTSRVALHVSLYGPGINWAGIKNPRPLYPSVLGAAAAGIALRKNTPHDGSFSLDFSPMLLVTGEALYETPRHDGVTFGAAATFAWTPEGF